MDIKEQVEKLLSVKVVEIKEVKGKVFPMFDLSNTKGLRIALIKDPVFIEINGEDIRENKMEGGYVVVEKDDGYVVMKYEGEPNVEILRLNTEKPEAEEAEDEEANEGEEQEEAISKDAGDGEEQEKEDGGEEQSRDGDVVKEILNRMPKWADGVVILATERDGIIVLPVKKSVKKEGFYASLAWKQLDVRGVERLLNRMITRNGKILMIKAYFTDKYINVYTFRRGGNFKRRTYGK
jgi:hypothetical protein